MRRARASSVFLAGVGVLFAGCATARSRAAQDKPVPGPVAPAPVAAPAADGVLTPATPEPSVCALDNFTPSPLTQALPLPELDGWSWSSPGPLAGSDREHPIMRCGHADSYRYVASIFRCADGKNPLRGSSQAAAMARRGNVGPSRTTGHIIDQYEVPCADGPERVFIDLYACVGEDPTARPRRQPTDKALRIREGLPKDAYALMSEGIELEQKGQHQAAINLVEQALVTAERELGAEHPQIGMLLDLLAVLHKEAGQEDKAEQAWLVAYQVWNQSDWPQVPLAGNTCLGLARAFAARKQRSEAECFLHRGIASIEESKSPFDSRVVSGLSLMAALYHRDGNQEALAQKLAERALRLGEMGDGPRDPGLLPILKMLIDIYVTRGDVASAEAARRRLQSIPP